MKYFLCCLLSLITMTSYSQTNTPAGMQLLENIKTELGKQKGIFALAFTNLQTKEQIVWNGGETFHAASTMKTPVMIEVFKQVAAGKFSLTDNITVKNEFKSIVDSSVFNLNPADDSQQELYRQVGTKLPLSELVYQMIIMSSNLATNIIMEMVDGKNVTQTMRDLGAKDILVLRGVEDQKAFDKGLINTTTAYDLMLIFNQMAEGKIINKKASDDMIKILLDQKHNTLIPALLPKEVKVAHKTGTITGVHHDSGIIFLPDGRKYTLVILSKKLEDEPVATAAMARVSEMIYQYVVSKP
ncbi:MAG: serine hydrolase [Sediminibacterium sp.]|nr:serine hydrolase [Sediminibacterium sp.]